jgi:hypothetical protein
MRVLGLAHLDNLGPDVQRLAQSALKDVLLHDYGE